MRWSQLLRWPQGRLGNVGLRSKNCKRSVHQAKNLSGEVFINGQYPPGNKPRAIFRSFLSVQPEPLPAPEVFTPSTRCTDHRCFDSANFYSDLYSAESDRNSIGVTGGQLEVRVSDYAADTNGKVRITSKVAAQLSSSNYLHVTMDGVNHVTRRRYPQIITSDAPPPVQDNLPVGKTIILQTFDNTPSISEFQLCNHRTWDVNNQCPRFNMASRPVPLPGLPFGGLRPLHMISDKQGKDRSARCDAYFSSTQSYLFLDGAPYGCVIFPDVTALPKWPGLGDVGQRSLSLRG